MHKLYELKEMMCDELEKYGDKKELSAGTLEVVDKLAHAIKNLDKIIEKYEEEEMSYDDGMSSYEGGRGGNSSYEGGQSSRRYSNRGGMSSRGGSSYARGRGRNAKRDSMGRYSSRDGGYSNAADDMVMELREMMEEAPEEMKGDFKRFISKIEQM